MEALEEVRGRRGGEERGDAVVKLGECEDAHGEEVADEGADGEWVDGVCGAVGSVARGKATLTLSQLESVFSAFTPHTKGSAGRKDVNP